MSPTVGHVTHRRDRATLAFAVIMGWARPTALRPEVATREVASRSALIRAIILGHAGLSRLALTARSPVDHRRHAIEPPSFPTTRPDLRVLRMSSDHASDFMRRFSAPRRPLAFLPDSFTRAFLKLRLQTLFN